MLNIILSPFAGDLKTERLETSFEAEPIYQFRGRRKWKLINETLYNENKPQDDFQVYFSSSNDNILKNTESNFTSFKPTN